MVEDQFATMDSSDIVNNLHPPVLTHDVEFEGNLSIITSTISIDILVKLDIIEKINVGHNSSPSELESYTALFKEFRDIFSWTFKEILGIDPSIIVHEIRTYLDSKPVC